MMKPIQTTVTKITWDEVAKTVEKINPELATLINNISPDKRFPLLRVRYPFGCLILDNGKIALDYFNQQDTKLIQDQLSYAVLPLALSLNKCNEVFIKMGHRIIPLNLLSRGEVFGLFEILNELSDTQTHPTWCVASGARSIFMLPKINNAIGHQRLRKAYGITSSPPKNLSDQWEVFAELVNAPAFDDHPWTSDVIYFTQSWFDKNLNQDPHWLQFYQYLFKKGWRQTQYCLVKPIITHIWQLFSSVIQTRKLSPRPYVADTIKHLLLISHGVFPAFRPLSAADSLIAPIKLIQDIYENVYNFTLEHYYPCIMDPGILKKNTDSVYYSLNYPILCEGYPEQTGYNLINELREIKLLLDTLCQYKISDPDLLDIQKKYTRQLHFEYFHGRYDMYDEIKPSTDILKIDKNFSELFSQQTKKFPEKSTFLSGCIRIAAEK